jgi:hypothetical protein
LQHVSASDRSVSCELGCGNLGVVQLPKNLAEHQSRGGHSAEQER